MNERYGLVGLLWLGLLLRGAKMPGDFFIWSCFASLFILARLRPIAQNLPRKDYRKEFGLALCLILSQLFSKNPSVTSFYTAQFALFLLLWIALKADPAPLPATEILIRNLIPLGGVACAVTLWQMGHGPWLGSYGLIPTNPIFNATWMAAIGVFLIAHVISEKPRPASWYRRWIEMTAGVLLIVMCGILPARSSVLGLLAGLVYAARRHVTARRVIVLLALGTLAVGLTPNSLIQKRFRLNERNPRLQIWWVALQGGRDHPWVGRGMGNFELTYQQHAFPFESDPIRYARTTSFAHNEFLQILSDGGLPMLALLLWGIGQLLAAPITRNPGRQAAAKTLFILLGVVAFYNIIWHVPLFIYLAILSSRMVWDSGPPPPPGRSHPVIGTGLVLVLVSITLSLGWQALRDRWAAQGHWNAILHWNSDDADAWTHWAAEQHDANLMVAGYGRASARVPEDPYDHETYALALEASRRPEAYSLALEHYLLALQFAPSRAPNALAIGRILFLMNQPGQALAWFQKALSIEPTYWESDLWIARSLARQGQTARARNMLRNLKTRRNVYLNWRRQAQTDLGPLPDPTYYEKTILGYDDAVINRELAALSHKR